jgi:hypothetical protein
MQQYLRQTVRLTVSFSVFFAVPLLCIEKLLNILCSTGITYCSIQIVHYQSFTDQPRQKFKYVPQRRLLLGADDDLLISSDSHSNTLGLLLIPGCVEGGTSDEQLLRTGTGFGITLQRETDLGSAFVVRTACVSSIKRVAQVVDSSDLETIHALRTTSGEAEIAVGL